MDKGMATKRPVADVFQIYVNYVHGYVFFNNYNGKCLKYFKFQETRKLENENL